MPKSFRFVICYARTQLICTLIPQKTKRLQIIATALSPNSQNINLFGCRINYATRATLSKGSRYVIVVYQIVFPFD